MIVLMATLLGASPSLGLQYLKSENSDHATLVCSEESRRAAET
jgi:hypothetical protein